jgi:putative autotransporter adhesin-like protein
MIRNYLFLTVCVILLISSGCGLNDDEGLFGCINGEGETITEELALSDFSKIKLKVSADVYVTQGDFQKVEVKGQQNIIHQLDLDVNGETWEIEFDDCVRNYNDLKIYITIPEIKELNISGSGMIYGENDFAVGDLRLRISGSGDIDLIVDANDIDSKISGSGKIKLGGTTNRFKLAISGSGDYRTFDLGSEDGEIEISGSGDAEVNVSDELDIDISGSGDVYYKGAPALRIDISGSGNVIDAN